MISCSNEISPFAERSPHPLISYVEAWDDGEKNLGGARAVGTTPRYSVRVFHVDPTFTKILACGAHYRVNYAVHSGQQDGQHRLEN